MFVLHLLPPPGGRGKLDVLGQIQPALQISFKPRRSLQGCIIGKTRNGLASRAAAARIHKSSMKSHFAIFLGSLLFAASPLLAQDAAATQAPASPAGTATATAPHSTSKLPAQFIDAFFKELQKGKVDDAYDRLLVGSKIVELSKEVSALKSKTTEALHEYGDVSGYEVVNTKTVGTRLVRVTCISLGSSLPIRWRFFFYKTPDHWKLVDIRVDDHLVDLFDEPAEPPQQ